jgi:hypothetical protein
MPAKKKVTVQQSIVLEPPKLPTVVWFRLGNSTIDHKISVHDENETVLYDVLVQLCERLSLKMVDIKSISHMDAEVTMKTALRGIETSEHSIIVNLISKESITPPAFRTLVKKQNLQFSHLRAAAVRLGLHIDFDVIDDHMNVLLDKNGPRTGVSNHERDIYRVYFFSLSCKFIFSFYVEIRER